MSIALLQPDLVRSALGSIFDNEIFCERRGDEILLDTPYTAGRGYLLRAHVSATEDGITVSDGGFATSQIETFVHSTKALRHRYTDLESIAGRLGLSWDGQFYYTVPTLEDAMRRLKLLAQAVQEGQELTVSRSLTPEGHILADLVASAKSFGLVSEERVRIQVPGRERPLTIDLEVTQDERRAALEIVAPRTMSGATNTINRLVTDFYALAKIDRYRLLVGVYDLDSPIAEKRFHERFDVSKPGNAFLFPATMALEEVHERLAA
jgi:hypothetical protein